MILGGQGDFVCCHAIGRKRQISHARPPRTCPAPACSQPPPRDAERRNKQQLRGTGRRCSFVPGGTLAVLCPRHRGMNPWAMIFRPPGWAGPAGENSCVNVDLYETYRVRSASIYHRSVAAPRRLPWESPQPQHVVLLVRDVAPCSFCASCHDNEMSGFERSFKFEVSSVKTGKAVVGLQTLHFTIQTRPKAVRAKRTQCATGEAWKGGCS